MIASSILILAATILLAVYKFLPVIGKLNELKASLNKVEEFLPAIATLASQLNDTLNRIEESDVEVAANLADAQGKVDEIAANLQDAHDRANNVNGDLGHGAASDAAARTEG